MNNSVYEALQRYVRLKEECKQFNELKREAFMIFRPNYPSEAIMENSEIAWMNLQEWCTDKERLENFSIDYEVFENFEKLKNYSITREELIKSLRKARNQLEEYEKRLNVQTVDQEEIIRKLYDEMAERQDFLGYIMKYPGIKSIVIDFILFD